MNGAAVFFVLLGAVATGIWVSLWLAERGYAARRARSRFSRWWRDER